MAYAFLVVVFPEPLPPLDGDEDEEGDEGGNETAEEEEEEEEVEEDDLASSAQGPISNPKAGGLLDKFLRCP